MGRPSTFSHKLADAICASIAAGKSIRAIAKDDGMPSATSIFKWLREHDSFAEQYARAKAEQAETLADEIAEIADANPKTVPVYAKDGELLEIKIDTAFEQWRRTRIDARKWVAAKLLPKKYGERVAVDHGGSIELTVSIASADDLRAKLRG